MRWDQSEIESELRRKNDAGNVRCCMRRLYNNNQNDDKKIQKLVKVYESMKPKEAAKIFNDLQIGVLVELALNMKESRLAAILSEMTPEKARELTSILATQSDMVEF